MLFNILDIIHMFVNTGHILEKEDMCAIFNWNDQKIGVNGEVIIREDT